MELNNIEKQIKEKLDSRTIEPSAQAWDRLDAMLTVAENEKSKKNYNWLYVAASFLGFILIGTIFFSQTEELIDIKRNNIVIENKKTEEPIEISPIKKVKQTETVPQSIGTSVVSSNTKKTLIAPTKAITPSIEVVYLLKNNQIQKENSIINQKTEQNIIVPKPTDAIVDKTVAAVDNAPEYEINNKKSTIKVDASSLLSQVNGELELSFREKVIKTAGKKYNTVKVALANRNQE